MPQYTVLQQCPLLKDRGTPVVSMEAEAIYNWHVQAELGSPGPHDVIKPLEAL